MNATAHTQAVPAPVTPSATVGSRLLRRKCACGGTPGPSGECAECRGKRLQRRSEDKNGPSSAPPVVGEALRRPGRPLDGETRAFMEPRFGHDFGRVRVHTDAGAAESARAVGALAYTVGPDVVFGAGRYRPRTDEGRRLLAHELSHVVQQGAAGTAAIQRAPAEEKPAASTATPAAVDPATAGTTPTKAEDEVPATDAAIEALDLAPTAKAAAQELKKKRPEVGFTSGRRNTAEQARAMASNIVSSNNRKWIEDTYSSADALQKWVDDNPEAVTVADLTAGLSETMDAMAEGDLRKISKHLTGEAFDVQPQEKDADAIKADIKALPGLTKFLEKEGGLVRWHAQFKRAVDRNPQPDRLEREADLVARRVVSGDGAGSVSDATGAPLQRQTIPEPNQAERRPAQPLPNREPTGQTARGRIPGARAPAPTPLRVGGYTGQEPKGTIRIGWTFDDGPTQFTDDMKSVLRKRGLPATWFVMLNQIDQHGLGREDNLAKLKKLQDGGDEIAIHSMHPTINHACWFPVSNPGCTKGWDTTAAAMTALADFARLLRGNGIRVKFVRLPTGLHDEAVAYLKKKGAGNPEGTFRQIIEQQNTEGGVGTPGSPEAEVKKDFDLVMKTLRELGLHLWGGGTKPEEVQGNSWEAESSGVPKKREDTINARFQTMIDRIRGGKRRVGSYIILGHDTTMADVQEVGRDIDEMERLAGEARVRLEYYNESDLYRAVRGQEP